jgi:hypothetical protein
VHRVDRLHHQPEELVIRRDPLFRRPRQAGPVAEGWADGPEDALALSGLRIHPHLRDDG